MFLRKGYGVYVVDQPRRGVAGRSTVPMVVAEFLTGNKGVGFLLASNANQFNSAGTFAAVVVLASMSFILDRLLSLLTRRALSWKEATRPQ